MLSERPFYALATLVLILSCHDGLLKDKAVWCGCGSYVVDDGTGETVESSRSSGHKRRRL